MATLGLGSMVVQLDLDGADFIRNTGQARQALGQLPREIDRSTTAFRAHTSAVRLASRGLSELTGISSTVVLSFERMTESALAMSGVVGMLGQVGVAVATFIGSYAGTQILLDELRNLRDFGELTSTTFDRLKTENEDQKKFAVERRTAVMSELGLRKDQAAADSELAVLRSKFAEDELGEAQDTAKGKLAALDFEFKEKKRIITETVAADKGRAAQLIDLEGLIASKRKVILEGWAVANLDIETRRIEKVKKAYLEDTQAFIDQIKRRMDADKELRASLGAALGRQPQQPVFGWQQGEPVSTGKDIFGLGSGSTFTPSQLVQTGFQSGGMFAGLEKVRDLNNDIKTFSASLAKAQQEGARTIDIDEEMGRIVVGLQERARALNEEFADSPAVLDAVQTARRKVDFGGFRIEVAQAQDALAAMGRENSVEQMLLRLAEILTTGIPAGVKAADPELQKLSVTLAGLRGQLDGANGAAAALVFTLAGTQAQAAGLPNTGAQVFEE